MHHIQDYPIADSSQVEPFESLVGLYFQLHGYITSANKWFWFREEGKRQRGYQDIDLLAVNGEETVIISVTHNLDDKIRGTRTDPVNQEMFKELLKAFERQQEYLQSVQSYRWLIDDRKIRRIVAFATGPRIRNKVEDALRERHIELVSFDEVLRHLQDIMADMRDKGYKSNNPLLKLVELWTMYPSGREEQ